MLKSALHQRLSEYHYNQSIMTTIGPRPAARLSPVVWQFAYDTRYDFQQQRGQEVWRDYNPVQTAHFETTWQVFNKGSSVTGTQYLWGGNNYHIDFLAMTQTNR